MSQAGGGAAGKIILGKYRVGGRLGQGSFATVLLAHSLDTNAAVAIKVIDKQKTNVAMGPLILREIAIMRRLDHHPNIIRISDLLATRTKIYIVMDLASGGDLYASLRSHPGRRIDDTAALHVLCQLVSALQFCHLHRVSHRDLKPHNILLDDKGGIKLSDFGLSSMAGEGPPVAGFLLKTMCGTPAFMAPEVIGRRPYAGPKADAWSCGAILYMMLTGAPPFDPSDGLSVMHNKMMHRHYKFPPNLSQFMMGLICCLLDPNPKTRLSIDEIVKKSWFKTSTSTTTALSLTESIAMHEAAAAGFDMGLSGTAFDIIGSSHGLDLWGLVDDVVGRKRRRFLVDETAGMVAQRAAEVGVTLKYEVKAGEGGKIWLKRGSLLVVLAAAEVVEKLSMVEVLLLEGCPCVYCGFGAYCQNIATAAPGFQPNL